MKVLTLTTQFANNYGALLQCYALCRFLNNQEGVDCEVINYLPTIHGDSWGILRKPRTIKDFAKIVYSLLNVKFVLDKHEKDRLVRKYIEDNIPLTASTYDREAILANPPKADIYICGSDQIWNHIIFKEDLTYYFDFVKEGKRVAYAASVADPWPPAFEIIVRPLLNRFDAISLREKGNVVQAQSLAKDIVVHWVADPVFLLSKEHWEMVSNKPSISEPYIFCYFLNVDPFAVDVVNKLRKITGYKVVNLALDALDKFHSDMVYRRANPFDFIGFIKHASYICTNSFHCSAFSIIFEKKFAFIPKSWANERVLSLEEIFKINLIMTREKYENMSTSMFEHNYSRGRSNGQEFIQASREFLLGVINGTNN